MTHILNRSLPPPKPRRRRVVNVKRKLTPAQRRATAEAAVFVAITKGAR